MAWYVKVNINEFKDQRWYVLIVWNVKRGNRKFSGTASPYRLLKVTDALLKRHGASLHRSLRGKDPIIYRFRNAAGPKVMIVDLNENDPTLDRESSRYAS